MTAYLVICIDTTNGRAEGVGVFSEPQPTVTGPRIFATLETLDMGRYDASSSALWKLYKDSFAYSDVRALFPVTDEQRRNACRALDTSAGNDSATTSQGS